MTTTVVTPRLPVEYLDIVDYHDALDRLKLLNRGSGFGITIQRTKSDKRALKQTRKVHLQCFKSRAYKSTSTGQRKSSTKSTECPYRASLTRQDGGWRVDVLVPEHNHELDFASPEPTLQRRQKPRAPHRAIAAFTPYPMEENNFPLAGPSHPMSSTPQAPGIPAPFAGPPQFFPTPQVPRFNPVVNVVNVVNPQVQPEVTVTATPTGSRHNRRGGYAIMTEIKRIQVPASQRLVSSSRNHFSAEAPAFLVYNEGFNAILGQSPNLLIAYEDKFPFAHGAGIYSSQHDLVLVTSNKYIPEGKFEKTVMISKMTRKPDNSWIRHEVLTVAVMANGGTNYSDNAFLFCAQGDYRDLGGLVSMDAEYPHRTTPLLNNYNGRRFNSLNDVAVHPGDGSIWFTDPIYGFEEGLRPKPELPNQVYRFDPQTGDVRVVADGFDRPKGICFSNYERSVYITDTGRVHGDGSVDPLRPATIYAFDIIEKRSTKWLTNRRVFAMVDTGIPQSIKCDIAGNVYAACGDGLNVWNSAGTLLGKALIPGGISSFCFGRHGEMFLLNENRFWIMEVANNVVGAVLERMRERTGAARTEPAGRERDGDSDGDSMASLFA
ncbi:hypothetical protein BCR34DRAFT_596790 [Clohesyomyces aquaticus]|uniref:SMP-30/Gluconolactonase/LRE-like region domain-containing protein n=1 Tax=Clohesyomyces aquaticus TaxID=1231657 RepID=A0A1Y2A536_9PLEO|nr:hypothetical protein BCR34DRAFT_596790 [Clohesyomyces aquaticus]